MLGWRCHSAHLLLCRYKQIVRDRFRNPVRGSPGDLAANLDEVRGPGQSRRCRANFQTRWAKSRHAAWRRPTLGHHAQMNTYHLVCWRNCAGCPVQTPFHQCHQCPSVQALFALSPMDPGAQRSPCAAAAAACLCCAAGLSGAAGVGRADVPQPVQLQLYHGGAPAPV